ncbi:MAG: hypothetical protein JNM66_20070 [Bryobacterales bacterium]|nr:hypothetical protein [Bryobacterales bacterium]
MVTSESMMEFPFEWGSTVRVKANEAKLLASVCGFRLVETQSVADEYSAEIGEYLVLVEFSDGDTKEIPASQLERLPE